MDWSDADVYTLRKMAADRHSASEIATAIGGGLTRNAVIGKAHRLGISLSDVSGSRGPREPRRVPSPQAGAAPRKDDGPPRAVPRPRGTTAPRKPKNVAETAPPVAETHAMRLARAEELRIGFEAIAAPERPAVPLVDLKFGQCRYPLGDPRHEDFGFCGAHAGRKPYCPTHTARCYDGKASR
ncbi:GcrA family cell cycle regulator [Methylocystis parvus]|uniref:GcrA family cell cycle regulator n=1 Tax=Methylocystis parvus TaxID=134 RepID=UPI003C734216